MTNNLGTCGWCGLARSVCLCRTYVPLDRTTPACFLSQFSDKPCDGRLVRCHLISQSVIRKECKHLATKTGSLQHITADTRSWVWGCGGIVGNAGHHGMLDVSRTLRIPYDDLPQGTIDLAEEIDLGWWLIREYR